VAARSELILAFAEELAKVSKGQSLLCSTGPAESTMRTNAESAEDERALGTNSLNRCPLCSLLDSQVTILKIVVMSSLHQLPLRPLMRAVPRTSLQERIP
jgi:hypothetical protein